MSTKCGFVTIVGKPNAGKSTLMNSILGSKLSIITPKPQTTRKRVLGIYTENDIQIVFTDTPGLIKPEYEMQKLMMNYVHDSLSESDVILYIIDYAYLLQKEFPNYAINLLNQNSSKKVLIINKVDLIDDKKKLLPIIGKIAKLEIFDDIIPLSALKKDNLQKLIDVLSGYLPEAPFYYEDELLSTQPQRFFVSELIRETIFDEFEKEIPYSTEVQISEFKERPNGKWYISADIIIERNSQKRILIGEKGQKIKIIGEISRKKIEEHLESEIYLELFVKVRENWRNDSSKLKFMGY